MLLQRTIEVFRRVDGANVVWFVVWGALGRLDRTARHHFEYEPLRGYGQFRCELRKSYYTVEVVETAVCLVQLPTPVAQTLVLFGSLYYVVSAKHDGTAP